MHTNAVIFEQPLKLALRQLELVEPGVGDVTVDVEWSGISTGTERLLWNGQMPSFPGMGYPLVPGYEAVGRVVRAGEGADFLPGQRVFVPGARCFGEVRGLFGGAASRLVVADSRAIAIPESLEQDGILLALAATAQHAIAARSAMLPELIVGHGVLGRLLARISVAAGGSPVVWERNKARHVGAVGYSVIDPAEDIHREYQSIYDVSGDAAQLDILISRLATGGEIVLAGFYAEPLQFAFPPAFMREARFRVAAEWQPADLKAVVELLDTGRLSLQGLITHHQSAKYAEDAYRTAFGDPACLKMILDWRNSK